MVKLRFDYWRLFLSLVVAFVIFFSNPSLADDALGIATLLVVSYIIALIVSYSIKKRVIKRVVAFDMGGVFLSGDYYTEELKEMPGMRDLITELKGKYVVVLLSNNNALAHTAFEKKFGLSEVFDKQFLSGDVGYKKPDPKIFQAVMRELGVSAKNVVFFDDAPENVVAAKKLGIRGIVFKNAVQAREAILALEGKA